MRNPSIHDLATGKWRSLLKTFGIAVPDNPKTHGPCPICGGKDRYRFDDRAGRGTWICNQCGAGTGVDLVMKIKGVDFATACTMIKAELPAAAVIVPKQTRGTDPKIYVNQWRAAQPLCGTDPASLYLRGRGISMNPWPNQLRFDPRVTYRHEDGRKQIVSAMLALFVSPDAGASTVHITYLDATGRKADVPKQKKLAPCPVPQGGAVRLAPSAPVMGVAEGIETALSAMLIHDIPVWAALSANALLAWQPPPTAQHVIVFGDNDRNLTGQHAAVALAYRLQRTNKIFSEFRIPEEPDTDFNDLGSALARVETAFMEAAE